MTFIFYLLTARGLKVLFSRSDDQHQASVANRRVIAVLPVAKVRVEEYREWPVR